jgi:hypothetical protein
MTPGSHSAEGVVAGDDESVMLLLGMVLGDLVNIKISY